MPEPSHRVLCPSENVPGLVYSGNCWVQVFVLVFVIIPMEGVSTPLQPPFSSQQISLELRTRAPLAKGFGSDEYKPLVHHLNK